MKLLITTGIYPPEIGGPATYSKQLAEGLVQRGHQVRVITYAGDSSQHTVDSSGLRSPVSGLRTTYVKRSFIKPWHYYKYYLAVKKQGEWADIIFAQGPVSEGYPSYLANKKLKKPFLVKVVGDRSWEAAVQAGLTDKLIEEFQRQADYPGKIKKMREIQKLVCQSASLIITPSEFLKRIVSGWGIQEKKIKVISNAVDVPADIKPRSKNGFLIISAGRDVPWKGFKLVDEVVSELRQKYPGIQLQILHDLPKQDYLSHLAAADLFVLNSGYEGFSHSLLEAMALDVPVIASRAGGNPEVITDGQNGLLTQYNDKEQLKEAVEKVYNDKSLREKLSSAGRQTAEQFGLEKMIGQTEQVLFDVISSM